MPKKIDPALRVVREHWAESPTITAAVTAVARQEGVGYEPPRRWVAQADVDAVDRDGLTSEEAAEIRRLRAVNKRLCEDVDGLLRGGTRPPQPMILAFIDQLRSQGHAVESVCQVLRDQGVQIAVRTCRAWSGPDWQVAARTITDAIAVDLPCGAAWTMNGDGVRQLTPEGLYGRRKMLALLRRGLRRCRRARSTGRCDCSASPGSAGTRASGPRSRPKTGSAPRISSTGTSPHRRRTESG